jgi:hypothetical protein
MAQEREDGKVYFVGGLVTMPGFYYLSEKFGVDMEAVRKPVPYVSPLSYTASVPWQWVLTKVYSSKKSCSDQSNAISSGFYLTSHWNGLRGRSSMT